MAEDTCFVFHPSDEEFRSFRSYLERIETQHPGMGICKVVPPPTWRVQQINIESLDCTIASPVRQHVTGKHGVYQVELLEHRNMSAKVFLQQAQKSEYFNPDYEERERRFWKYILGNSGYGVPLYGADVPGTFFDGQESHPAWNLNSLDNILQALPAVLPGVTQPMLYFGSWRSLFAYHVEDVDLYSINYLHTGADKSWYSISPANRRRFEQMAEKFYPGEYSHCHEFLRHKTKIFSPQRLQEERIPYNTVVQHAGEFVITFPGSYHAGFNHGFNIAEATNFALSSWLPIGRQAYACTCTSDTVKLDVNLLETLHIREIVRCLKNNLPITTWTERILPFAPMAEVQDNEESEEINSTQNLEWEEQSTDSFFVDEKSNKQKTRSGQSKRFSSRGIHEVKSNNYDAYERMKTGLICLNNRLRCICHYDVRYCQQSRLPSSSSIFLFTNNSSSSSDHNFTQREIQHIAADREQEPNRPVIDLIEDSHNLTTNTHDSPNSVVSPGKDNHRAPKPKVGVHDRSNRRSNEDSFEEGKECKEEEDWNEGVAQCTSCGLWFHPACVRYYYSLPENQMVGFDFNVLSIPQCHVCHTIDLQFTNKKTRRPYKRRQSQTTSDSTADQTHIVPSHQSDPTGSSFTAAEIIKRRKCGNISRQDSFTHVEAADHKNDRSSKYSSETPGKYTNGIMDLTSPTSAISAPSLLGPSPNISSSSSSCAAVYSSFATNVHRRRRSELSVVPATVSYFIPCDSDDG